MVEGNAQVSSLTPASADPTGPGKSAGMINAVSNCNSPLRAHLAKVPAMTSHVMHTIEAPARSDWAVARQGTTLASHLYLVTPHELQNLRSALARGAIPVDLEFKLARLSAGSSIPLRKGRS